MKIYKVYHNSCANFHPSWQWGEELMPDLKKLALIALVNCDTLEDAFWCTNHIERNWLENPNVFPADIKARSSMAGDVVEDPDGRMWVVAAAGWKEMVK
jgi:hypothetical protein